jgi:peptide chain release factor 1
MNTLLDHTGLMAKLDDASARYDAITDEMNDPAKAGQSARMIRLSKEMARLAALVVPYREMLKIRGQLQQARELADDPAGDPEMAELARAESADLQEKAESLMEGLIDRLIGGEDASVDSVIIEIRAGTGGDEAALFARDLFEIYSRYAEARGFKLDVMDLSTNEYGGYREAVFNIKGPGVFTYFGYEGGGHRVQRVPITETQGRIHTSAATVAVLPEAEETEVDIDWDKDVLEHVSAA